MGIRLATFQQHQLTAQDYALLCAKSVSSGIFYGCNVTIKDESTLHVTTGVGIANGRTFDVTDDDYPVELTGGGSMVGRIYVHVDLADVDTPAQILVVKGATLPALVQDSDMNESTGVWDLELATFDVDASEISNLVYTASGVSGGGGGAMLAPYYDASEAWLKDQIFQKDGLLYKCLTDIAPGTPLVVDTNVKVTDFAEETEALNQNLTQRNVRWNTETYFYEVYDGSEWIRDRYFNPYQLDELIPQLTSASGNVFYSSYWSASPTYYAWYAFDRNTSTGWLPSNGSGANQYVGYSFGGTKQYSVGKLSINLTKAANPTAITIKLQGSNTGTSSGDTWEDIYSFTSTSGLNEYTFPMSPQYKYFRVIGLGSWEQGGTGYWKLVELQLYGREVTA